MMNTKVNSGSIRSLYDFLNNWIEIVNKYIDYFDNSDNPWWYNERATISTLAAAGWQCKESIALEEYSTEKGRQDERWKGRCDLFFGMKNESFAFEAKQAWCPIGCKSKNGITNITKMLAIACDDARKLDKQEGRRLGACFAVPYLPKRDKQNINEQIEKWLKEVDSIDCSAYAWTFPEGVRLLASSKGIYYPGIAIIIKEVYRKT